MKLMKFYLTVMLMAISSIVFSADNLLKLDPKRDSAPYKAQILGVLKKTEGFRWESKVDGIGYVISQETGMKSNWNTDTFVNGIFVKVKKFYYGTLFEEYIGYARQSNYEGYVEIYDWKNTDKQIHIKYESNDTVSLYYQAYPNSKKYTFNKVESFNTNTPSGKGNKSSDSAEDLDLIH